VAVTAEPERRDLTAPTTPDVWAGVTPRDWQLAAFTAAIDSMRSGTARPLLHAATGAGKSRLLGGLAAACTGDVLVTTPTQALVDQLASTIAEHVGAEHVGRAFQHEWDTTRRVTVCCIPSLAGVLDERPTYACWLADEAHRLEGTRVRSVRDRLTTQVAVGVTATPYTADWRGLVLWDRLVYSYTSDQAIRDGVLVPWRVVRSPEERDVEELTAEWVAAADGPGIVSATSVTDAEECAARLDAAGIPALPIHGYLPREEQARRIVALAVGRLRCLVHCQLLTEGVDFPWLRWLLLRRPVASPVRLVQEVGRVLRAHPGKTHATLYDPHDALGAVGLVHGASLEDAQRGMRSEPAPAWEIPELPGLDALGGLPRSAAITALEGWATDTLGALRMGGVADAPDSTVNPSGAWRRKRASEKQRAAAQKWSRGLCKLPEHARSAVSLLLEQEDLKAGAASDVLSILVAVAKRGCRGVEVGAVGAGTGA
jgi:superfamily II DNA or RNA helicase